MTGKPPAPPTADSLRHSIDSGETGDKADWPDPAAAPLGTDDEAAGYPPTREQLDMETSRTKQRTPLGTSAGAGMAYGVIAVLVLIALVAIVGAAMG